MKFSQPGVQFGMSARFGHINVATRNLTGNDVIAGTCMNNPNQKVEQWRATDKTHQHSNGGRKEVGEPPSCSLLIFFYLAAPDRLCGNLCNENKVEGLKIHYKRRLSQTALEL